MNRYEREVYLRGGIDPVRPTKNELAAVYRENAFRYLEYAAEIRAGDDPTWNKGRLVRWNLQDSRSCAASAVEYGWRLP